MKTIDILTRALEARNRTRSIERELEVRRAHLGPQGHGYDVVRISGALDPMRNVDNLLDAIAPLEAEREACLQDVEDGRALCRGAAALVSETAGKVLELHYCVGCEASFIAEQMHYPESLVQGIIDSAPAGLDAVGVPRLMQAGRSA